MPVYTEEQIERFWGHVDKTSSQTFYNGERCWAWSAARFQGTGYGALRITGTTLYAHRVAYEISVGKIQKGMEVCHHCDNPPCVNPSHLFLGTRKENAADMIQKGRQRYDPKKKLTDSQIDEIRRRYAWRGIGGETAPALAKEFGVHHDHILDIVHRRTRSS